MKTLSKKTHSPACLWMQAGVVAQKKCTLDYFCTTCQFDKALRKVCKENRVQRNLGVKPTSKKQKLVFWVDKLKVQPLAKRPCVHYMKNHIEFKICPKNYQCVNCEFDQYFHDQFKVFTVVSAVDFTNISGVSIPDGYYLHPGHTWVKIEDNNHLRIGIDDFANRLLGEFDRIDAPLIGKEIHQAKPGIKAKRGKNFVSFQSPVSGVVTQTNPQLRSDAGMVHKSPYTDGWIMTVHCKNLKNDLKNLLFLNDTKQYIKKEVDHLFTILENETGLMAADGGQMGNDIFGNAPGLEWDDLVKNFITKGL